MDILAAAKANDVTTTEEPPQPIRGNKISKKNKKKNKNQDWEDESNGIMYNYISNITFYNLLSFTQYLNFIILW